MDSITYASTETRSQPYTLPCAHACTNSSLQGGMRSAMETAMQAGSRRMFCPQGYSELQIAILSVLRSPHEVLAYWQIARIVTTVYGLDTTEGAVRGAVERLACYNLLVRERASRGLLKGNRYAFKQNPCPHIPTLPETAESAVQAGTEAYMQIAQTACLSIQEKIDRNNLSLSSEKEDAQKNIQLLEALTEDDIAFHWPELARLGFGTDQIRQIISRLAQVNIGAGRIMQGLTHAEWELCAGRMRDKSGSPVTNPVSWVFKILATQGYYPRPEGYRSPQEQAECDATKELQQQTAAYEARMEAEAQAWVARLAPDEQCHSGTAHSWHAHAGRCGVTPLLPRNHMACAAKYKNERCR